MKHQYVKNLVSSGIPNGITFFSFGMVFIADNISRKREEYISVERNLKTMEELSDFVELVTKYTSNYIKSMKKRNIKTNEESKKYIYSISNLSLEKTRQLKFNIELLKMNKHYFDFDAVNEAFIKSSNI